MTRLKQGTPAGLAIGFICEKFCSASVGFDPITLTVCRHDTDTAGIDSTSRITSIQYTLNIDSINLLFKLTTK